MELAKSIDVRTWSRSCQAVVTERFLHPIGQFGNTEVIRDNTVYSLDFVFTVMEGNDTETPVELCVNFILPI